MTKPVLAVSSPTETKICPNCWEPYETRETRQYCHPCTGELVPSVTNIIGYMPQFWMGPWAARMAAQHGVANWYRLSKLPPAERIEEMKNAHKVYAEEKANVGDLVHDLVDHWSTGRPFGDYPNEVNGFVNRFIDFLTEKRPRFLENETTFWSRTHEYAGTGDFIVHIDGKTFLTDLKTGKNLHPEVGLQTSALAHADFILRIDGTEQELPHIDGIAALHLRPRSWKFVVLQESEKCFDAFLAARKVMEWSLDTAPRVLG